MINRTNLCGAVFLSVAGVQFLFNIPVSAQHPMVPAFARFQEQALGVDGAAQLLIGELGCAACHQSDATSAVRAKQAPILDGVSSRIRPDHLLKFIADPGKTKPGTTMPDMFQGKSAERTAAEVKAIVHYLKSLSGADPPQAYASASGRARGEILFHRIGCVACHAPRREGAPQLATSKPLGNLPRKYTLVTLASFLLDPHKTRPAGRMPSLNLTSREAYDIAAYLLPNVPQKSGIAWELFKGKFGNLPDFSKLKPVGGGETEIIDVKVTKERDNFALRFEGMLPLDKPGEYTFFTISDDGSKLYVDEKLVVNNDGVHPEQLRSGKLQLKAGRHRIVVEFFEAGGGERIHAEFQGPGLKRQPLAPALMAGEPETPLENLALIVDAELVAKGRELFGSIGCSSCHQLKENGKVVAGRPSAKSLAALTEPRGCLSDSGQNGVPNFQLSKRQFKVLMTALKNKRTKTKQDDASRIARTMAAFNCYACHVRGGLGGIERARQQFFQTTQPEMGIEGSIPPGLDGVGAKLTRLWLENIMANGAKDRPYMYARMPKFGTPNVGHMVETLGKIDHITLPPKIDLAATRDVKNAGWKMVGASGFACIKCHTFGRFKATGVQSIDMSIMHKRLREDWFRSYIRNPQVYRKGTRMPAAWPMPPNKSLLRDILDGDSEKQIKAVWHYLSDGPRARTPFGLVTNSLELFATNEALIYRNFIEGAGPRGIGVAYPEGINLAFDANELRLALIWQGAFIDAKRHWTGRGQGFQAPAGGKVHKLGRGNTFAALESADASWPQKSARELGHRFRGYQLSQDRRPTFLYEVDGFSIEDFPNAVEKGVRSILLRKIKVTGGKPGAVLYYRAADGNIQKHSDGAFQVGDVKMTITADKRPIIRGKALLVPLQAGGTVAQTYEW